MSHRTHDLAVLAAVVLLVLPLFGSAAEERDPIQGRPSFGPPGPLSDPRDLATIRPGRDGVYGVYTAPPVVTERRPMGMLGGHTILEIDTPVHISGMGKYMSIDSKGNIWYVETREDKVIKIDPNTYEMTQYLVPRGAAPYSIALDNDDVVWVTAHGIEMLLEMYPEKGFVVAHQPPSHGFLIHINVHPETNTVWFTQPGNNQIVSYRRDQGFREYPSPTPQSGPGRLDFDSAGNVWFPELYTDKLARLDPKTGVITEWDTPSKNGLPAGVRVDRSRGDLVWVNQPMADRLATFRGDSWVREYQIPTEGSVVSTNVTAPDGYVWFTEGGWRGSAGGNKIGRLDPESGEVIEFSIPHDNAQPLGMILGHDGSIWFSLVTGAKVGRVLPSENREKTAEAAAEQSSGAGP